MNDRVRVRVGVMGRSADYGEVRVRAHKSNCTQGNE